MKTLTVVAVLCAPLCVLEPLLSADNKLNESQLQELGFDVAKYTERDALVIPRDARPRNIEAGTLYKFRGKRPSAGDLGGAVPFEFQIGEESGKDVYVELFAEPETISKMGNRREQIFNILKNQPWVPAVVQSCTKGLICVKTCVKDGETFCCRWKCENGEQSGPQ